MSRRFRLTLVTPCVGRARGQRSYLKAWLMEPLAPAVLAALAPSGVETVLYDDRLEQIPYDEPTDLVAISVETYTALRAYEIASEYRRRKVPVVMGGFHATLAPDETARFADSVVVGGAEPVLAELIDDYRLRRPRKLYQGSGPGRSPGRTRARRPDRSILLGKRYLPIRLVEASRGCSHHCSFCSVQAFYQGVHEPLDLDDVLAEVDSLRGSTRLIFFVDDNISAHPDSFKELLRRLVDRRIGWVSQSSIDIAQDEEALELMRRSGCRAILIGLESLDRANLRQMRKGVNLTLDDPRPALQAFRKHGIPVYGTFAFGYDQDEPALIERTVRFGIDEGLHLAAFNHITPFPGTELLDRLEQEGRMRFESWWLDRKYRYGMVPFEPSRISASELEHCCLKARRDFFAWPSITRRAFRRPNAIGPRALTSFLAVNAMHRGDAAQRYSLPLGDRSWTGSLLEDR